MNISSIVSLFDWRSIIDIPLISLVLFLFYTTLRSSGSWRIASGIMVALFLYIIARFIQLPGVEWIFNNLSNIALIALIVIFQPEIRKIFEKTSSAFKIKKLLKESSGFMQIIVKAVFHLAEKRWGAILIIPGKEDVRSKLQGGFSINADVSTPLILSIFDPHSPGHDGGMLIENSKIGGFGFRLPLSLSGKLDNRFGTRHHASLGLSEATDACVITISEERGAVTVFHAGSHIKIENEKELEEELTNHLKDTSGLFTVASKKKIKSIRVAEAFASLVVGTIIWLAIVSNASQIIHRTYAVPLQYTLPEKMVIVGEKTLSVRVTIGGTASEVERIQPDELKATVNIAGKTPGQHSISLHRKNFNLPGDIRLIDVDPVQLQLDIHAMEQRDMEIKPQIVGSISSEFEITSIDVNPSKIAVLYTTEITEQENIYLTTTPIFINTITQSTKIFAKIIAPQGIHPVDTSNWPDVAVMIYIRRK